MSDLKRDMLKKMLLDNHGILRTADVIAAGISKEYFYQYAKTSGLEKIAHGIYASAEAWLDEMYLLQLQFSKAIFSYETALYLHDLSEMEPMPIAVTVAAGYNPAGLVKRGIRVYKVKPEWYDLGICLKESPGGHMLRLYDMERTICDIIRRRSETEVSVFKYALTQYSKRKDKDLNRLGIYAQAMRLEKQIRNYMEVLL